MEAYIGNKIQIDFLGMGLTIFELWVMKIELWVMETTNPNDPLIVVINFSILIFFSSFHELSSFF